MSSLPPFAAVFLACAVETVEALTIVLGIGTGAGLALPPDRRAAAMLVLAALVAALGPALTGAADRALRLLVGATAAHFGLVAAQGDPPRERLEGVHDEAASTRARLAPPRPRSSAPGSTGTRSRSRSRASCWKASRSRSSSSRSGTLRAGRARHGRGSGRAARGGGSRGLVRAPLSRVPENRIKLAVGLLLTTFGCFWAVEGAGAHWPGRRARPARPARVPRPALLRARPDAAAAAQRRGAARGEDVRHLPRLRRILVGLPHRRRLEAALGVLVALAATITLARAGLTVWWLLPGAVAVLLAGSLRHATRTPD